MLKVTHLVRPLCKYLLYAFITLDSRRTDSATLLKPYTLKVQFDVLLRGVGSRDFYGTQIEFGRGSSVILKACGQMVRLKARTEGSRELCF